MKKNILVFGGNGFIGINIIEYFQNRGYEVYCYGRSMPFSLNNESNFIFGTLDDIEKQRKIFEKLNIVMIFYLINTFPINGAVDDFYFEMAKQKRIVSMLIGLTKRFVFFSSGGRVYKSSSHPHHECDELFPVCDYGRSKIELEDFISVRAKVTGTDLLIIRPSNPYGKYQTMNGVQGLIPNLIGRILSNQVVDIWGRGDEVRDYIYIEDFVRAFFSLCEIEKPSHTVYNIGSGIGVSTVDILSIVKEKLCVDQVEINNIPNRSVIKSNILCVDRLVSEIGFFDPLDINVGISRYICWLGK